MEVVIAAYWDEVFAEAYVIAPVSVISASQGTIGYGCG